MHLTAERLFSDPSLLGRLPTHVRFSPDGKQVTFLAVADDDRERLDLYCYEIATRRTIRLVDARDLDPQNVSMTDAEKAERERKRFFAGGITAYQWRPTGGELLLVSSGQAFVCAPGQPGYRRLTPPDTRQTEIRYSPGGGHVSWVRDGDLYTYNLAAGNEERITHDASETIANGIADFIAQEEMHRYDGHWWSLDDRWIAFTRVDTSDVPVSPRYEIDAERFTVYPQRYPYAGTTNAAVSLRLFDRRSGQCRSIEYRNEPDDYLARVAFGHSVLAVQVQSRDQRNVVVKLFPLDGGPALEVVNERSRTWVNLHGDLRFVPGTDELIWTSDRDGIARLYRVHNRSTATALTPAGCRVNKVLDVAHDRVHFSGWIDRPVEQHLFAVGTDGIDSTPGRLTHTHGWHDAVVDPSGTHFIDARSSLDELPRLEIVTIADGAVHPIAGAGNAPGGSSNAPGGSSNAPGGAKDAPGGARDAPGGSPPPYVDYLAEHVTPELGTLIARDGQTMWYRVVRPAGVDPSARYPVVVSVYGGPGVQRVRDEWAPLSWQLFVQAGIGVFELDNRGGGNREKAFEDPLHGRLGAVEVADQLAGVEFLKSQRWVDPARIGLMGHSYGGFLTLMCLCRAPGVFRAGVAGAPVTDWALYDTHYTERYLGTPQHNAEGYRESKVLSHIHRLKDPLLVIHGMADDNVLFTHSTMLFKALQDRLVPFEMMTYPGAKHALQQRTVAIHRQTTILNFFKRHLLQ